MGLTQRGMGELVATRQRASEAGKQVAYIDVVAIKAGGQDAIPVIYLQELLVAGERGTKDGMAGMGALDMGQSRSRAGRRLSTATTDQNGVTQALGRQSLKIPQAI